MLTEERRRRIQEILQTQKRILVNEIADDFNISAVTIRKDLEILEKRGVLSRVHGGAIVNHSSVQDLAVNEKERINVQEKNKIARKAESLIKSGDVIILDSGSTTTALARHLKFKKDITVITNAVNIASELTASEVNVILTGGNLREKSFSLVGPIAEESLKLITADKLFLGVDGIDFERGLTTPNIMEAKVNRMMIQAADEVILLADSSKFGRRSLGVIDEVKSVDKLITDKRVSKSNVASLENLGIEVILA
ncbi:MAG: transcriptional repressor AgaR [Calditrichia bacterium]